MGISLVDLALHRTSPSGTGNQDKKKEESGTVSVVNGEYYCTYSISKDGKWTLVSKVRMVVKQRPETDGSEPEKQRKASQEFLRACNHDVPYDRQQADKIAAATKINTVEAVRMLEENVGIMPVKKDRYTAQI